MPKQLKVLDHLVRYTCRISASGGGATGMGTGFFYAFPQTQGLHGIAIVTNKHVVDFASEITLHISCADDKGAVIPNGHVRVELTNVQSYIHYHPEPEIDLACFPIGSLLNELLEAGRNPIFSVLTDDNIPREGEEYTAVEDILMVGYPLGIYDSVHNRPIVRRGITASSYDVDYEGRPEFVIDAACFPGSSGSPVLLVPSSPFADVGRFKFLGVLHAGPTHPAEGEVVMRPIPTKLGCDVVLTPVMMNLGYCVKAVKVSELVHDAGQAMSRGASDL